MVGRIFSLLTFAVIVTIFLLMVPSLGLSENKRVVCYVYDTFGNDVSSLDISFCTDIVISACYFNQNANDFSINSILWEGGLSDFAKRKELKDNAGNRRLVLGIAGERGEGFQNIANKAKGNSSVWREAISALKSFVEEEERNGIKYDGISIDWEFPENGQDFENFMTEVFKQFKEDEKTAGRDGYEVSIAVGGWAVNENRYNLKNIHSDLDHINLMGYDYNYNDPARPNSPINEIKMHCEAIVDKGVDITKINVLLPYYARYGHYIEDFFKWGDIRNTVSSILAPNNNYGWNKSNLERKLKAIDLPSPPNFINKEFYVVDPYSMYRKVRYLTNENKIKIGKNKGNVGGVGIWQLGLQDYDADSKFEMGEAILAGLNNQKDYPWPGSLLPHIESIDPPAGIVGTKVTIQGSNFGVSKGSVLFFGGKKASIRSWTSNEIVCAVPKGVSTGYVVVTTKAGVSNGCYFICLTQEDPGGLSVAQKWRNLLNEGNYEEAWNALAEIWKSTDNKQDFIAYFEDRKIQLGKMSLTFVREIEYSTTASIWHFEEWPEGNYGRIAFQSIYENILETYNSQVFEEIITVLESDGKWRVRAYGYGYPFFTFKW